MKKQLFIITIIVLFSASCINKQANFPSIYTEKLNSTPDLMQTDPTLGLVEGGTKSCVTAAVANSLAWLAENGYDNLMIKDEDGAVDYARSVQVLDRILRPAADSGASPPILMSGLERYLAIQDYTSEDYRLEFQGWYHRYLKGEKIPDLTTIKRGVVGKGAVWLFIGFYKIDENKEEYQVISHHYVTLVGFGVDEDGNENPNVLIVHDPAPRSGPGVTHNYVQIEELKEGQITIGSRTLAAFYPQLPINAAGYYKLGEGLAYNPNADLAILDGVIMLEMK